MGVCRAALLSVTTDFVPTRDIMDDSEVTILDHISGIGVPGRVFDEPANEYWQLCRLWAGMEYLYSRVAPIDAEIRQRIAVSLKERFGVDGNVATASVFGNAPELAG